MSTSWPSDETRSLVPVSVLIPIQLSSSPPSSSSSTAETCHSYDPRLRGMITTKPLPLSSDDIIVSNREVIKCDADDDCRRWSSSIDHDVLLPDSIVCWHRGQSTPLSDYEASMILSLSSNAAKTGKVDSRGKPTEEHLQKILLKLSEDLPQFFTEQLDFSIYHENLVFQNNIKGLTTYGLPNYIRQLAVLRLVGHIKFSYVQLEVLKVTKHSEDGTVRVRWRIHGIPGFRIFLQLWKFPVWKYRKMMTIRAYWYDAISTFYVGGDGLVHSHVCDKMMPDEQKNENISKTNLAAKLALLLGAIPRPSADDLGAMIMALSRLEQLPDRPLSTPHTGVTSTGPN